MTGESHSETIESTEKVMKLIEALRESKGSGVTNLAKKVGTSKSTAHRHLNTLKKEGYITKDGSDYRLGLKFHEIGNFVQGQYQLYNVLKDRVDELAEQSGEKVWLIVNENDVAVYLYGASGKHAMKTYAHVGQKADLHHLAGGKAILAFLPENILDSILKEYTYEKKTEHTIDNEHSLRAQLELIRESGVAFNLEESVNGLNAIAAPIKNEDGGVYGAISISGPASRLSKSQLRADFATIIRGIANEAEISIKYS